MNKKEAIIKQLLKKKKLSYKKYRKVLSKHPKKGKEIFSKNEILFAYNDLLAKKAIDKNKKLEEFLKTKPTRTISGVAPVTVLTKPYECPGKCIFCPTMDDQPKSYLTSEPGAARAKMLHFDPYKQTRIRIKALRNIGHNTDKIELIILGGTWSHYPKIYQIWFVLRCFQAMNKTERNEFEKLEKYNLGELEKALMKEQKKNETAKHRNVGLTIETRPDFVTKKHVKWLRFLGATKVQLGIQSTSDEILKLNKRGHTTKQSKEAIRLFRQAGFKIHIHWMANLYGSDPKKDHEDFLKLFDDKAYRPDELKIYPCIIIKNTPLFELFNKGEYKPYTEEELLDLMIECKLDVPEYCRITRLFRDFPSFEIEAGVKKTNFRQIVKQKMKKQEQKCFCIRCREVKGKDIEIQNLKLDIVHYLTTVSEELFLEFITPDDKIAGFLRLSFPRKVNFINEIDKSAMIREVHVYGKAKKIDGNSKSGSQHKGLGTQLLKVAEELSKKAGFKNISVISAIGTRGYYGKKGYKIEDLYMHKTL